MKRYVRIASLFMLATSLVACDFMDQLLTVNVFDSELKLTASDVSNMSTSELTEEARSPDFYDALEADPAVLDAVLDNVNSVLGTDEDLDPPPTVSGVEGQEAAILGAHVWIYTSPAGDLINNVVSNLDMLKAQSPDPDIAYIIETLVPPSVYAGGEIVRSGFITMIDALESAAVYYNALGASLAGAEYSTDTANPGQIAQNAVVAALVSALDVPVGYIGDGTPSKAEYLYDLIMDSTGTIPEPLSYEMPGTDDGGDPPVYTPLGNILLAAGFDPAQFGL